MIYSPPVLKRVCELKKGDHFILNGVKRRVVKINDRIHYSGIYARKYYGGCKGSFGLNNKMKVEICQQD